MQKQKLEIGPVLLFQSFTCSNHFFLRCISLSIATYLIQFSQVCFVKSIKCQIFELSSKLPIHQCEWGIASWVRTAVHIIHLFSFWQTSSSQLLRVLQTVVFAPVDYSFGWSYLREYCALKVLSMSSLHPWHSILEPSSCKLCWE